MDYIVGFIFIIPVVATCAWVLWSTRADLAKYEARQEWWRCYFGLFIAGCVIGGLLAFYGHLRLPAMVLHGMPVPLFFERYSGGAWVITKPPIVVQFGSFISNVLVGATALVLPLKVAALIKHFKIAVQSES